MRIISAPVITGLFATLAIVVIGLAANVPAMSGTPRAKPAVASATDADAAVVAKPAVVEIAADPYAVKRILKIDAPLKHGDYVWDDAGVPEGPVVITVDLKAQTLSVFRAGYEIGVAVILYGADDKPTPLGTYPILQKKVDHISNLYNAPMPYMMRLTNDGVAIHGSEVSWGGATHGCIGVPTAFAKLLFGVAKLGDQVIVTNGKMMDLGAGTSA